MRFIAQIAAICLLARLGAVEAAAQEWPVRSVRVIVPVAAGGGNDLIARSVAEEFLANTRQAMVVDNRLGGAGTVAAEIVARSEPDGYNLLYGNSIITGILPHILKQIPYELWPVAREVVLTLAAYAVAARLFWSHGT